MFGVRNCTDTYGASMRFLDTKSQTYNLQVLPIFKKAMKVAAGHEQRSMINILEVLLGDYLCRKDLHPEPNRPAESGKRTKSPRRVAYAAEATA